jgi:hypothetical protein
MRLRWLQKHLRDFSPSRAWKWYYRRGYRKGFAKGVEKGRHESTVKMCERHELPLALQTVQLMSGTLIEGWFCPMWHEHSTPTVMQQAPQYPDAQSYIERPYFPEPGERHTDRIPQPNPQLNPRPMDLYNRARMMGAGPHTAVQLIAPKLTRNLNKWMKEQEGE